MSSVMSIDAFELVVIGSGGAAMAAAIAAREAGARVLLVESGTVGGTCVNVGCVPSKFLLAASEHGPRNDFGALIAQKDLLVAGVRQAKYVEVAAAHGFEVRHGTARFVTPDVLQVDGEPLPAEAYLVATGARPAVPEIEGLRDVAFLTSTTAMELAELPSSLVIIGGGFVGMEQAQIFADLGAQVSVVGRLAPGAEPELRKVMREAFARRGITVVERRAASAEADGAGVSVTTTTGERVAAERLLVATGRTPRTRDLNLEPAGVKTDDRGFVVVDEHQRTSNPRVFAAGDVTGCPQFVYVAAAQGRVAARNAVTHATEQVNYSGLPGVIFTRPQLASVGMTEEQAVAAGHDCDARTLSLSDVPRAIVNGDTLGAVKLVAEKTTGQLLGVHVAADAAGELMLAATYAVKAGMTVDDVAQTWAPYLTMAESLRLAAGLFRNHLPTSCCA